VIGRRDDLRLERAERAEQTRKTLEQQAALGRYMLEVRHNLNNSLTSVLGNSELLVLDNASTDDTPSLMAKFTDPRIQYRRNATNLGMAGNVELGRSLAKAPYVVVFNADDIWAPDHLATSGDAFAKGADVVFYDDLVSEAVLDRARRDAERVFVGKRKGQPGIGQEEINSRMVEAARRGRTVVRLKGGDPFIFGRGGEELEVLRQANIATVVVPGITAALGCAAEAGLPLTYRNEATRLTFVTAHRADDAVATDWSSLADPQTTLVVYMGLASAAAVRDGLIKAGRDAKTPAGVFARGTRPDAQTVVGTLDELPALAQQAGEGPALLVIGDVVARSDAWRLAENHLAQELAA